MRETILIVVRLLKRRLNIINILFCLLKLYLLKIYFFLEFASDHDMNKRTCLIPRGLKNPSNYCYINSILQALIACPPFYNLLKDITIVKKPNESFTPMIDNM